MKTRTPITLRAFTLIELMLSTALIALLMLLFITMVEQTSLIWKRTTTKVAQFQSTRAAFDAMTRSLSQATLNTYWQVDPPKPTTAAGIGTWSPSDYVRASDLHFVCGPASQTEFLGTPEKTYPTHAVFFQAPLGATGLIDTSTKLLKYDRLDNLLSAVGFYVEFGDDKTRPGFLTSVNPPIPPRYRFRLMQARQEGEDLALYGMKSAGTTYKPTDWIKAALGQDVGNWKKPPDGTQTTPSRLIEPRAMAENIISLVLLPKTSKAATGGSASDRTLAPAYVYDSRPASAGKAMTWAQVKSDATKKQWFNQLPPVVQVTMIAIDEQSAARVTNGSTPPDWTVGKFTDAKKMEDDLNEVETKLKDARVNYRIFSTDVVIRGSKWTRPDQ